MSVVAMVAGRALGMLVRPGPTFRAVAAAPGLGGTLLYGAVIAAVPQIVLVVLGLLGVGFRNVGVDAVLAAGGYGYAATLLLFGAAALLMRWLAGALDGTARFAGALALVVHATTPLWLLGAVGSLLPKWQNAFGLAGLAWAVALLPVGAGALLAVPRPRRAVFTFAAGLGLVLLWVAVLFLLAAVLAGLLDRELAERAVRGL